MSGNSGSEGAAWRLRPLDTPVKAPEAVRDVNADITHQEPAEEDDASEES